MTGNSKNFPLKKDHPKSARRQGPSQSSGFWQICVVSPFSPSISLPGLPYAPMIRFADDRGSLPLATPDHQQEFYDHGHDD